jgi:hypothetical protein
MNEIGWKKRGLKQFLQVKCLKEKEVSQQNGGPNHVPLRRKGTTSYGGKKKSKFL